MEKSTVVDVRMSEVTVEFQEEGKTVGRQTLKGTGKVGQQRLFRRLDNDMQKAVVEFLRKSAFDVKTAADVGTTKN